MVGDLLTGRARARAFSTRVPFPAVEHRNKHESGKFFDWASLGSIKRDRGFLLHHRQPLPIRPLPSHHSNPSIMSIAITLPENYGYVALAAIR